VSKKEPTIKDSIIGNNLTAAIIHVAVLVLSGLATVLVSAISPHNGIEGWTIIALVALCLYPAFGYAFISPLARRNFLSVFYFSGGLCTLAVAIVVMNLFSTENELGLYMLINNPALQLTGVVLRPVFDVGTSLSVAMIISAFIPPALMYLGLCLKVWQQKENKYESLN